MTRRQFLACLLMAMVVLVCLPLVKFAEWGERYFTRKHTGAFIRAMQREIDAAWEKLGYELSRHYFGRLAYS